MHQTIERAGGEVQEKVRTDLNYLVIGSIGTGSWRHSSFGLKIAKAMEYKDSGYLIGIISEAHWFAHLK